MSQKGKIEVTEAKSKGKSVLKPEVNREHIDDACSDININSLRQDEKLRKLVRRELETFGFGSNQSSVASSQSLSYSSEQEKKIVKSKDKKEKKHKHICKD